jgi:hypothetical protein
MHITERAPVLSATSRTVCIWIIYLSNLSRHPRAANSLGTRKGRIKKPAPKTGAESKRPDYTDFIFSSNHYSVFLRHTVGAQATVSDFHGEAQRAALIFPTSSQARA